ncbi:MAG: DUF3598 family protein [Cyanobacteria bacterium J06641_5]
MQIASQWDCLRQNLGEWRGSFTQLASTGAIKSDTPSVLTLEENSDRGTIRLVLKRWPAGKPLNTMTLEFGPPGPAPGTTFFESGAFSQGPAQWSPGRFSSEMALASPARRLRLVPIFESDTLNRITVIRECRAGSEAPERKALSVTDLVGTWQGEAVRRFPDLQRSPETFATKTYVRATGPDALEFGPDVMIADAELPQTARVDSAHIRLAAGRELMLLPAGGYVGYPQKMQYGQPFALEVGWHLASDRRERLIRRYGKGGEWLDLTWIQETRTI